MPDDYRWLVWNGPDHDVRVRHHVADDGRRVIDTLIVEAEAITGRMLRRCPVAQLEAEANAVHVGAVPSPPLRRPMSSEGDAFYRLVSERYQAVVTTTRAAAVVLAAESGAPAVTVHRWVREARRRGFLPPARQGRAG